ncbi:MAG: DUF2958 domain-containing protein [Planctomycetales bacterium]|nr:DUF2958 domain-containing protein [Planctomycetales bacterium]
MKTEAHILMTKELAAEIPPLYSQEADADPVAMAKLFTPDASWTWYVTEYDPRERLCFGLVDGLEREWGYFSLDELESVRGPLGLRIERDLHFEPVRTSALERELDLDR